MTLHDVFAGLPEWVRLEIEANTEQFTDNLPVDTDEDLRAIIEASYASGYYQGRIRSEYWRRNIMVKLLRTVSQQIRQRLVD